MNDKKNIEELFSKLLNEHQEAVRPELWDAIQTKMAANTVASTSGSLIGKSLLVKGIVGITSIAAIGFGAYVLLSKDTVVKQAIEPTIEQLIKVDEPTIENKDITVELPVPIEQKEIKNPTLLTEDVIEQPSIETFVEQQPTNEIVEQKITTSPSTTTTYSTAYSTNETTETVEKTTVSMQPVEEEKIAEDVIEKGVVSEHKGFVKPWNNTNVFTPNDDGINDYFFLETGDLKEFSISILDKENKVVFVSEDTNFRWDGTHYLTGEKVPDGNYSYIIYAVDLNGEQIKQFNLLYITK